MDIDALAIDGARKVYQNRPEMRFAAADATDFDNFNRGDRAFDVIVIRHPGPILGLGAVNIWETIFSESLDHLAEGGILMVTTYHEHGFCFVDYAMTVDLGAVRHLAGDNPFIYAYGAYWFRDHFVGIYSR